MHTYTSIHTYINQQCTSHMYVGTVEREAAVGDGYTMHMHTYVCTYIYTYIRTVGATERDEAVRDGYSIHTLRTYAYTHSRCNGARRSSS
jgi:hypothetical protein